MSLLKSNPRIDRLLKKDLTERQMYRMSPSSSTATESTIHHSIHQSPHSSHRLPLTQTKGSLTRLASRLHKFISRDTACKYRAAKPMACNSSISQRAHWPRQCRDSLPLFSFRQPLAVQRKVDPKRMNRRGVGMESAVRASSRGVDCGPFS
jgi:hypothetical protein